MAAPFSGTAGAKPGTMIGGMQWGVPAMDTASVDATPRGLSPLVFARADLTTPAANFLYPGGVAAVTEITMLKGGSILGFSLNYDTAPAAGTATLTVFKNGTAGGGIFTASAIAAKNATVFTTNLSSLTYAAGDELKVRLTTSAAFTANRDATVFLWVT